MKILNIDDHALIRDGLKYILLELAENVECFAASNYAQAQAIIERELDFDLVLLDIGLPDIDGFEALEQIARRLPTTPIIILSASESPLNIQLAIQKKAQGYIPKSYDNAAILQAIRQVLNGEFFMPSLTPQTDSPKFTHRQTQVLALLAQGKSNKQIASELNIATNTVNIHITSVFKILGVNNRTEAAFFASQLHLNN